MTTRNSKPRLRAKPDYIALGPIFPTTLKSMRFAPQGIPKITEWKKRIGDIPLVAIGGIKFEQAAEIFAAGADSIAVVSDVTQNADPDARVRHGSARMRRRRDMSARGDTPTPTLPRRAGEGAQRALVTSAAYARASAASPVPLPLAGEGGARVSARRVGARAAVSLPDGSAVRPHPE